MVILAKYRGDIDFINILSNIYLKILLLTNYLGMAILVITWETKVFQMGKQYIFPHFYFPLSTINSTMLNNVSKGNNSILEEIKQTIK